MCYELSDFLRALLFPGWVEKLARVELGQTQNPAWVQGWIGFDPEASPDLGMDCFRLRSRTRSGEGQVPTQEPDQVWGRTISDSEVEAGLGSDWVQLKLDWVQGEASSVTFCFKAEHVG